MASSDSSNGASGRKRKRKQPKAKGKAQGKAKKAQGKPRRSKLGKLGGTPGVGHRREKVLELLLEGKTITDAAAESGYTRGHVSKLVNHDERFRAELARRQQAERDRNRSRLTSLAGPAITALHEVLRGDDPRVKASAAAKVLELLYGGKAPLVAIQNNVEVQQVDVASLTKDAEAQQMATDLLMRLGSHQPTGGNGE